MPDRKMVHIYLDETQIASIEKLFHTGFDYQDGRIEKFHDSSMQALYRKIVQIGINQLLPEVKQKKDDIESKHKVIVEMVRV